MTQGKETQVKKRGRGGFQRRKTMQLGINKVKEYLKVKDKQRISFFEQYMEDNKKKQEEVLNFVNNSKNKKLYNALVGIGDKDKVKKDNPKTGYPEIYRDHGEKCSRGNQSINFRGRVGEDGELKGLMSEEIDFLKKFLKKIKFEENFLSKIRNRPRPKTNIKQSNPEYDVDSHSNGISQQKLNISNNKIVKRDSSSYFSSARLRQDGQEAQEASSPSEKKSQFIKGHKKPSNSGSSPKNNVKKVGKIEKLKMLDDNNYDAQDSHRDLLNSPKPNQSDLPTPNNQNGTDSKSSSLKTVSGSKFGKKLKIFNQKADSKTKKKLIQLEESQKNILKKSEGLTFKASWSDYFKFLIPSFCYDYSKGRVFKKVIITTTTTTSINTILIYRQQE